MPLLKNIRGDTREEQEALLKRVCELTEIERNAARNDEFFAYYSKADENDEKRGIVASYVGDSPVTFYSEYYYPDGCRWGIYVGVIRRLNL